MFTLLAKLVRKLSRKQRNDLADKLVSLAKGESSDEEQSDSGQPSGNKSRLPICNAAPFFSSNGAYASSLNELMALALERGSFCGIIVCNTDGSQKIIFSQDKFDVYQGLYKLTLYAQGYGSGTTMIQGFTISQIFEDWKNEFEAKASDIVNNPSSGQIA